MRRLKKLFRKSEPLYHPPYYLIDANREPKKFRISGAAKLLGGVVGIASIVGTASLIYERSKAPLMDAEFRLVYTGYEVRVINRGTDTAKNVSLECASWFLGSPGTWVSTYPSRDIPPRSDSLLRIDLIPTSLGNVDRSEMFEQLKSHPMSGYFTVTCTDCREESSWAFHVPAVESKWDRMFAQTINRPIAKVRSMDEKPSTGQCVEFPVGVCPDIYEPFWRPRPK